VTPARIAPRARREAVEAARWIARDNPAAARSLQEAIEAAAGRIGRYPRIGVRRPDLAPAPYRFVQLIGYPYIVIYADDRVPPVIVRIVHAARDLRRLLRDLN
jgi:plasmid stabilization system protein ParE